MSFQVSAMTFAVLIFATKEQLINYIQTSFSSFWIFAPRSDFKYSTDCASRLTDSFSYKTCVSHHTWGCFIHSACSRYFCQEGNAIWSVCLCVSIGGNIDNLTVIIVKEQRKSKTSQTAKYIRNENCNIKIWHILNVPISVTIPS